MIGPLFLLIGLSIMGGYLGIPQFLGQHEGEFHWGVAAVSLTAVAAGLVLAWWFYGTQRLSAQQLAHALALPTTLIQKRFYVDEFYTWYVDRVQQRFIARACALFERFVIIGVAVNGTAGLTRLLGRLVRYCQTGKVQTYVLVFLAGVLWLVAGSSHPPRLPALGGPATRSSMERSGSIVQQFALEGMRPPASDAAAQ